MCIYMHILILIDQSSLLISFESDLKNKIKNERNNLIIHIIKSCNNSRT